LDGILAVVAGLLLGSWVNLTCRNFINQLLVAGSSFGLCIGILAAKPLWTVAGSYLTVN
jgi:hypothetical protein